MDTNASGASKEGASDERILALVDFRGSDLFSDAEKVALELSEAMTDTPQRVTDELFGELQQHYTNPQIVELASIIALENFRSRFNRCGAVEPHGFYPMLGELLSAAGMPTDAVPQPA